MNKKILVGVIAIIIAAVGIFTFSNLRNGSKLTLGTPVDENGEVRPLIITTNPWEPHSYIDENGIARGIAVDVVGSILSKLDVDYEVKLYPWTRVMAEVEEGTSDVSFVTAYRPEREEFLYYVEEGMQYLEEPYPPYYSTMSDSAFFVRRLIEGAVEFDTPADIVEKKYRVGVISGFNTAKRIYETGIDPDKVVEYFDTDAGFEGLLNGEIDIYLQEKAVGFAALKKLGLTYKITAMPQSFFKNPQYVGFSKNSDYPNIDELRKQFLEELRKIHESGEYEEIYNSYIE